MHGTIFSTARNISTLTRSYVNILSQHFKYAQESVCTLDHEELYLPCKFAGGNKKKVREKSYKSVSVRKCELGYCKSARRCRVGKWRMNSRPKCVSRASALAKRTAKFVANDRGLMFRDSCNCEFISLRIARFRQSDTHACENLSMPVFVRLASTY